MRFWPAIDLHEATQYRLGFVGIASDNMQLLQQVIAYSDLISTTADDEQLVGAYWVRT